MASLSARGLSGGSAAVCSAGRAGAQLGTFLLGAGGARGTRAACLLALRLETERFTCPATPHPIFLGGGGGHSQHLTEQ